MVSGETPRGERGFSNSPAETDIPVAVEGGHPTEAARCKLGGKIVGYTSPNVSVGAVVGLVWLPVLAVPLAILCMWVLSDKEALSKDQHESQ